MPMRSGSGSSHGRRGGPGPTSAAASMAVRTAMLNWLVGRPCGSTATATPGAGDRSDASHGAVSHCASHRVDSIAGRATWGAAEYATCTSAMRPGPGRTIARPGAERGRCAAAGESTTSRLSSSSATRSARRIVMFARIESVTTPAGRCVASTRWMPRLRPRCARSTSPSTKSGSSAASVANSSTTTTSAGPSQRSPPAAATTSSR